MSLSVGAVNFLKLITGNASGPMLFTFGKLKVRGDLLLAARIQSFFEVPGRAASRVEPCRSGSLRCSWPTECSPA